MSNKSMMFFTLLLTGLVGSEISIHAHGGGWGYGGAFVGGALIGSAAANSGRRHRDYALERERLDLERQRLELEKRKAGLN